MGTFTHFMGKIYKSVKNINLVLNFVISAGYVF